jgi:hypothetical protein
MHFFLPRHKCFKLRVVKQYIGDTFYEQKRPCEDKWL